MSRNLIRIFRPLVERFPGVAMAYRYLRDVRQMLEEPKETPMGFKLSGNLKMQRGIFEPEETELAKRILAKVDVFINVGANVGYYCCLARGLDKHVVAFEPVSLNVRYLLKNIKANDFDERFELFPLALSNEVGIMEMYGGGTKASLLKGWSGAPEQHCTLVPTSTLDNVLGSRFEGCNCFVLVDIEGAERWMLQGASTLLSQNPRPIWMVEISVREHQPEGVSTNPNLSSTFQVFWERGYEAWTAQQRGRPIQYGEIEAIAMGGGDTLPTHNILFLETARREEILESAFGPRVS